MKRSKTYGFFKAGDKVRVLHRGKLLRGEYVFCGVEEDPNAGPVLWLRRHGRSAERCFRAAETSIFDFDAQLPAVSER